MKPASHKHNRILRLIAGWCGLLMYVGAFCPVGLGAAALLGVIDPDHRAFLEARTDRMQIVLHHEGKRAGHQHHAVARTLAFFAQPVSATNPDHILQFSTTETLSKSAQLSVPPPAAFEQSGFALVEAVRWSPRESPLSSLPPHPSSAGRARLPGLRTTLLLI